MTGLGSSCGACKFLRRKCTSECVFAPYFCYDQAATHFAAVHKVFGASNVSKLLLHLPVQHRSDAALTMSYEALARMRDPIYGCVSQIFALQQQVAYLQEEIETLLQNQMVSLVSANSSACGSSEGNSNSNTFRGLQVFPAQQYDIAVDRQKFQNQPEPPILLPQVGVASTNQGFSSHDHQMDIQMPTLYEWEEVKTFGDRSTQDSLEKFLEDIDQENLGHNPWLNDPSIAWNWKRE
ncbi:PREDICTED: LOB domain-containing protein 29 [Fragaria vesca subsp. vesca]|uniref:LOB domain-containing protein 29 n=1 Tax=Fragaria vesca subsp. vesca TaxID=101020 RepID=UPI0002C2E7CB|nr:PREDICTED: LOB domain-containing protein 29 [Fragaria vesca subsp. vesca]